MNPEVSPEFWKNFLKKPLAVSNVEAFFVVAVDSSGKMQSITNMTPFSAIGLFESVKARYIQDQVSRAQETGVRS